MRKVPGPPDPDLAGGGEGGGAADVPGARVARQKCLENLQGETTAMY